MNELKSIQNDKPVMVSEFWPGWFDQWGKRHQDMEINKFGKQMEQILAYPASFNIYLFHAGTNFGFMNGATFDSHTYDSYSY